MAKWLYPLVGLIYILLFSVGCSALVLDKNTPIEENKEDISELLFKKTPPKPILVTDIKTSSNLFPNKIEISWSNTAVGVYYSKIFSKLKEDVEQKLKEPLSFYKMNTIIFEDDPNKTIKVYDSSLFYNMKTLVFISE